MNGNAPPANSAVAQNAPPLHLLKFRHDDVTLTGQRGLGQSRGDAIHADPVDWAKRNVREMALRVPGMSARKAKRRARPILRLAHRYAQLDAKKQALARLAIGRASDELLPLAIVAIEADASETLARRVVSQVASQLPAIQSTDLEAQLERVSDVARIRTHAQSHVRAAGSASVQAELDRREALRRRALMARVAFLRRNGLNVGACIARERRDDRRPRRTDSRSSRSTARTSRSSAKRRAAGTRRTAGAPSSPGQAGDGEPPARRHSRHPGLDPANARRGVRMVATGPGTFASRRELHAHARLLEAVTS